MQNPAENNSVSQPNRTFRVVLIIVAIVACLAAGFAVVQTIRGDNPTQATQPTIDAAAQAEAARNTIAITLGDHQLNAVEVNYFYMETVNNFCNQFSYYIYYLMDVSKPLNEQKCTLDESMTWADYFMAMTQDNIKSTYMLCDMAKENNFTLSEDLLAYRDSMVESIKSAATQYKYDSTDAYLEDVFGYGADLESYTKYFEMTLLADAYYAHYADSLTFDADALNAFEAKDPKQYNGYCYAYYTLDPAKFLTGGVEGSDGKVTYTDEQKAAAVEAAREAANALNGSVCADLEAFNALILGMDINASLESVSIKEMTDVFPSKLEEAFKEWLMSDERTPGQITVIPKTSKDSDNNEVTEGFYILWFGGVNANDFALKDVRHLLITFKDDNGKTYSDGVTKFTDAQKAAAKTQIDAILAHWEAGEMTDEIFAALATEKTEDPGSKEKGGLYTNIYPGQMVESFEKWCYDETREVGDYGIVETVYGYHLMFFVGDSEMTYREYMITQNLRNQTLSDWHKALVESAKITVVNLDYCELDLVLSPA